MASKMTLTLPTGQVMPALGFGTWQATDAELEAALNTALEAGYRHIDTAPVYENEHVIGKVLHKWLSSGKLKREELFVVSKVPPVGNRPSGVEKWIKRSLKDLQLDYLDLYLIHTPFSMEEVNEDLHPVDKNGEIKLDKSTDHLKIWLEMEKQVEAGRAKAIGLSNFNIKQITKVMSASKLPISNLQIELHVYFQQKELVDFCKKNGITVTAYSPLGSKGLVKLMGKVDSLPDLLSNPVVVKIGERRKKTPAQILLRYTLQRGIAAIPKSTNPDRLRKNIDLFDWALAPEDMNELNALDQGASARVCDFGFFKGIEKHPEFPF
ncbi:aldo-keto reductase family 1 member A1 [Neodiprion virginianus]|uniref:aldo-keto reductase family 1 member A1 n=1 Tax=Neodiprion virginianus TaxID=2961670 RepID=UPI001EE6B48E|nr:aldo-keto reductase family 1 member A1 [Neodiprion virginianus]